MATRAVYPTPEIALLNMVTAKTTPMAAASSTPEPEPAQSPASHDPAKKLRSVRLAAKVAAIQALWRQGKLDPPTSPGRREKVGRYLKTIHRPRISVHSQPEASPETQAGDEDKEKEKEEEGEEERGQPDAARSRVRDVVKRSSLPRRGREIKKHFTWATSKDGARPKQKDPLHQWFVDHSGGTLRQ